METRWLNSSRSKGQAEAEGEGYRHLVLVDLAKHSRGNRNWASKWVKG